MDNKKNDQPNNFLLEKIDQESEADEEIIIKSESEPPKRGQWNSRVEFILSCISMSVGLGNIWRFPYLCYRNGGGAFLLPFLITLTLIGLPLFFMELALGQFASLGAIGIWNLSPMFKGIGYGMTMVSVVIAIYYNVIIAQCIYYFGVSFNTVLPWSNCNNSWNNKSVCYDSSDNSSSMLGKQLPAQEYYENYVLNKSPSISDFGFPQWKLLICFAAAWIFVTIIIVKGVKIMGKVAYFTSLFPYIILTILLIRGLILPGSLTGIMYYIKPNFTLLLDPKVWVEAATQIFFSLGVCNGNLITMSSYNDFTNNCCRDAILFAIVDCLTSVYAGFVIFSNLGFMSHVTNVSISEVVKGGPGLAFIVYPEALNKMPLSPLWSVLFFLMMICLGFGSQIAVTETILSSFQDELRRFKILTTNTREMVYRISVCFILFLIGIPMTCRGGVYLIDLFDASISGYTMLVLALVELLVISYVYKINRFISDVNLMIKRKTNIFWKICWMAISPLFICLLIVSLIIYSYNLPDPYPKGFMILQHILTFAPLAVPFVIFLTVYCRKGGWAVLTEIKKPLMSWGPAVKEHKTTYMNSLNEMNGDPNSNYFQSKLSIADKFSRRAGQGENGIAKSTSSNSLADKISQNSLDNKHMVFNHLGKEMDILANDYYKSKPKDEDTLNDTL